MGGVWHVVKLVFRCRFHVINMDTWNLKANDVSLQHTDSNCYHLEETCFYETNGV